MNLIIFFATIDVLTFMALGILFSMKLRETRRIKEIEKEIEKFEARTLSHHMVAFLYLIIYLNIHKQE